MTKFGIKTAIIADSHELFRSALAAILVREIGFEKIVHAETIDKTLSSLKENSDTDFVALDLSMPGVNDGGIISRIRQNYPDVKLAVISNSDRLEGIMSALTEGVHGYIPKTFRISQFIAALHTIVGGNIFVPIALSCQKTEIIVSPDRSKAIVVGDKMPILSPRQEDVLTLMADGKSNKEIGRALNVAEGTVKVHVNALFRVLGAHNRMSAVAVMSRHRQLFTAQVS